MRKWLAIFGLVLTLLIACAFIASTRWSFSWSAKIGSKSYSAVCCGGGLTLEQFVESDAFGMFPYGFHAERHKKHMSWGFAWDSADNPIMLLEPFKRISIPLWAPLLLTAIPTFFLWPRPFRRPRPGHCRACGYDLKGAPSPTCPECGKSTKVL